MKSHGHEVTDFYDKKIPKLDSNHTCLAVLDSVKKTCFGFCSQEKLQLLPKSVFKRL